MGKLYDKRDMEYDLARIDKLEQQVSQQIAAGLFNPFHSKQAVDECEAERRRAKMRLLRTGQLLADLRGALNLFNACPRCHKDADGKDKACGTHYWIVLKAKRAVKYAADDNIARREAQGRTDEADEAHNGELNAWERWYFDDKRNGIWPGDAQYALQQFGSLDYKGWLQMLLEEQEMTFSEYQGEIERLRGAHV